MATKYQEIADALRSQIHSGVFDATRALPTENAIAQTYQVSRQTVRQALSLLVKEGLIVRRQGSGSRILDRSEMPAAPQRRIAVITTYIGHYIFPGMLREIENVLFENNCSTLLFATQNQVYTERKVLQTLLMQPVDGILVEGTKTALFNPNLDLYQQLVDRGMPIVFIHGNYAELNGSLSVLDDNEAGGRQLVEYLVSRGHTRIAGIFKSDDIQGHGRYAGYATALRDAGLPVEDRHVFWYHTELKDLIMSGQSPFSLMDTIKDCTAVVCYNDEIANYLINLLLKNGVRVPEEMAVVSFDDSQYCQLSPVPITSLAHAPKNTGRVAAEKLIRLMAGEQCRSEAVPWTLIRRESG